MTDATSASDRYDEARRALAEWDSTSAAYSDALGPRLATALRSLIEPPATDEMPDLHDVYSRAHRRALPNEDGPYSAADLDRAGSAGLEAVYLTGIQAAWNSWEPENAPGLIEEARYDRIEGAIRLAFEGEGEAWSDKLSGDRLAAVARRAIEEAGL